MSVPAHPPERDRVSLERFVAALETAGVWYRPRGNGLYFRCPLPDHEDSSASASADWKPPAGGRPGAVDFECHGCGKGRNGEIVAALGLTWSDLYDDAPARPPASSPRVRRGPSREAPACSSATRPGGLVPVDKSAPPARVPTTRTTRVFTDAAGVELARLHRYDPTGPHAAEARKGFSWEHRGGPRGGWVRGKRCGPNASDACAACRDGRTPTTLPLYRLPEVAAAVAAGHRVWITEGGKNADDLAAVLPAGEAATTAPDGARGPWSADYTAALAGATVTVIADRDRPGYEHARQVAAELRAAGCGVRLVRTPLEMEHGDASDHLAAGLGVAEFEDVPADVVAQLGAADSRLPSLDEKRAARQRVGRDDDNEEQRKGGGGGSSEARRLLELALALYEPIWTTTDECYLVPKEGPRIARSLRGGARSFAAELVAEFYDRTKGVAANYSVTDALKVVQGLAQRATPVELANRVARHGDALVLDLGDDTGRAVVVTAEGWEVVQESPVLFARTARTGALPVPERGAEGLDELWRVVHVRPRDRALAEAELVHRYFAGVSHPLPLFTGEAGSGKTSAAETLTALVDPAPAMKVSLPGDPKDWAVQIGQAYSLVLDNVSHLQQWQSDALCMAVTGGFTQYRQLYTDGGLARFGGQQCIALTSVDLGAQRADLTTRLLPLELQRFDEHERMSESAWAAAREDSRPRVLAVLLDRAATVLATLPRVDALDLDLPRLSDFARTCKALDLIDADRGEHVDRYGEYVRLVSQQAGDIADEDEVAAAVIELVTAREAAGQGPWTGTSKELHIALGRASLSRSKFWPETPIALGKRISAVVGPLREAGVSVDRGRNARSRTMTLYRTPLETGTTTASAASCSPPSRWPPGSGTRTPAGTGWFPRCSALSRPEPSTERSMAPGGSLLGDSAPGPRRRGVPSRGARAKGAAAEHGGGEAVRSGGLASQLSTRPLRQQPTGLAATPLMSRLRLPAPSRSAIASTPPVIQNRGGVERLVQGLYC